MPRFVRRVLPVALALHAAAAPLAAQLVTNPLPTRELYRLARERANSVNDRCVGSLADYLEAVGYMYAYLQAAGNDGSLRSDPAFKGTFLAQFDQVFDRAQRCLKAYPPISSAGMRSDGSGWVPPREPPPPGVNLQETPPASTGAPGQSGGGGLTIRPRVVALSPGGSQQYTVTSPSGGSVNLTSTGGSITSAAVYTAWQASGVYTLIAQAQGLADTAWILVSGPESPRTDARGRTLEQLSAEADRLAQENAGLVAEIQRLRTPAPTPARLNVEYRIRTKADNLYWHLNGNGDNLLSTRVQPNDDFTRFIIEGSGTGGYRIRNKATGRYLYAHDQGSNFLISSVAVPDERTVFYLNIEPDGSYRILSKVLNRYVHEDGNNSRMVTTLYQVDDDFTRFFFEP